MAARLSLYLLPSGSPIRRLCIRVLFRLLKPREIRLYGLRGRDTYRISGEERPPAHKSADSSLPGTRQLPIYPPDSASKTQRYVIENTIQDKHIVDNTTDTNKDFAAGDLINSPASDRFDYTPVPTRRWGAFLILLMVW
jgi:hypothetical protein